MNTHTDHNRTITTTTSWNTTPPTTTITITTTNPYYANALLHWTQAPNNLITATTGIDQ